MKFFDKIFIAFLAFGLLTATAPAMASVVKSKNPIRSTGIVKKISAKKNAVKPIRQSKRKNKTTKVSDVVTSNYIPGAPKGYMNIILSARNQYLKSSALAKRRHSASALKAAEEAYSESLDQANKLLSPVSTKTAGNSSISGQ